MEQKMMQLQSMVESDQAFGEKLFSLETAEEVRSLLSEKGMEFSLEEINAIREALVSFMEKGSDLELSDDDLEGVAGGILVTTAIGLTAGAISVLCGAGTFTHNQTRGRW